MAGQDVGGLGGMHAARMPLQQRQSDFDLQPPELLGHAGRAEVELIGGGGDRSGLHHSQQDLESRQIVHRQSS